MSSFQIVTQMPNVLSISLPTVYSGFLSGLWFVNLNFTDLFALGCIMHDDFHSRLLFITLTPYVVLGACIGTIQVCQFVAYRLNPSNPRYTKQQATDHRVVSLLIISFLVFTSVSTTVFQNFVCESFDDGSSRLVADYSIDCNNPIHKAYEAYSGIMIIIYPIGVPALYMIFLWKSKDRINPPDSLVVRDDERHLVKGAVLQKEKMKLRLTYEDIADIGFLYETYKPRCWYFEIVECFRRLMLTAIPVLIMRETATQVILLLLFNLIITAIYSETKPYAQNGDDIASICTQWGINLTLIVALMIRVNTAEEGVPTSLLGGLLITVHVIVITLAILTTVFGGEDEPGSGEKAGAAEADEGKRNSWDDRGTESQVKGKVGRSSWDYRDTGSIRPTEEKVFSKENDAYGAEMSAGHIPSSYDSRVGGESFVMQVERRRDVN